MRRSRTLVTALCAGALLAAAGCGGSSSPSSPSTGAAGAGAGAAQPSSSADAAIAAKLPEGVRSAGKLTVATEGAYPPFELFEADGKTLTGVDPELATAVAGVLGLKIELVNVKFDGIIPGLQAKRYDMGVAAFGDTAEREKVVDFVTYFKGGTSLLFPAGNPMGITLETLCGKRLAVQKGTIYESALVPEFQAKCKAAGQPEIQAAVFPGQPETILAVGSNRADVTISDFAPLAYTAKQSKGKFEVLQQQYKPILWGFAVQKGSGLAEPVQAAMTKLIADGTYTKILQKWEVTGGAVTSSSINAAASQG